MKQIESGTFVDEDILAGRAGTVVTADWLNAVQSELIAMVTRFGDTLGQGDTQIADMVERWRSRGDTRAALEWREIDSSALTGDIVWAGHIDGESFLLTSTWQLATASCLSGAVVLDTLQEDATPIARAAVHDAGDGRFFLATVDTSGTSAAHRCALASTPSGSLSVSCVHLWTYRGYFLESRAVASLVIDANTVRIDGIYSNGGTPVGACAICDLETGDELSNETFGQPDEYPDAAPRIALCGAPTAPFPVVLYEHQIIHPGAASLDPLSLDADWMAATGERRIAYLPALDRVCLWSTGTPLLWLGAIPASGSGDIAWRRIEFGGPILALVEHDRLPLCLSEGLGHLDCLRLFSSGETSPLSSTPAPTFSPETTALLRRRAFATVSRGVLWGWAYGMAFATPDPKQPFALRRLSTSLAVKANAKLVSADHDGHALCDASGLVVSGLF